MHYAHFYLTTNIYVFKLKCNLYGISFVKLFMLFSNCKYMLEGEANE